MSRKNTRPKHPRRGNSKGTHKPRPTRDISFVERAISATLDRLEQTEAGIPDGLLATYAAMRDGR